MQANIEEEGAYRPEFTALSMCFVLNMAMARSICINTNTWFAGLGN